MYHVGLDVSVELSVGNSDDVVQHSPDGAVTAVASASASCVTTVLSDRVRFFSSPHSHAAAVCFLSTHTMYMYVAAD